ncbi:MAG: precorrin-3B C(17)-methyltransferase [bacterium]|nr:precorrin-3B C(17)-methyltransferase [bacterium]
MAEKTEAKREKVLYVVGMGPGEEKMMTLQAREILENCDVIAGYTVYVDLLRERFPDKEFYSTAMKQEWKRCREVLRMADAGKKAVMVCSGDAGVYGMASPILECSEEFPQVKVRVIPGVTAALAGSALLGAPLAHDFAVISLSDLLTPMEQIEKRLRYAALGDFAICLYNPSSRKRADYLKRACDVLLECRDRQTLCAVVRQIGREGEEFHLLSLEELREYQADMFTTVFIGNASTKKVRGRMVTPRGYKKEGEKE